MAGEIVVPGDRVSRGLHLSSECREAINEQARVRSACGGERIFDA